MASPGQDTNIESIYLAHFQRSLKEVFHEREDYKLLFTEEERRLADPFLQFNPHKSLSREARYQLLRRLKICLKPKC